VSQPASTPPPAPAPRAPRATPPPAPAPPRAPGPHRGSTAPAAAPTAPPAGTTQAVGGFAISGNGAGQKQGHPAQAYGGIGNPAGHRAYFLAVAKHEIAGAAGVREGDAMLRREIRRAPQLTAAQRAMASWRLRRANRRLAGALEAAAKAAAQGAKVRAEVNANILSAKRKTRSSGFTAV
jgi:hypothetical protein